MHWLAEIHSQSVSQNLDQKLSHSVKAAERDDGSVEPHLHYIQGLTLEKH